ncbi:MAG: acetyltransferase [Solirubrobacterales bacterium]
MKRPLIIVGAGGHARVLLDALESSGEEVLFFTDPHPELANGRCGRYVVHGSDDKIKKYIPDEVLLVNGVGSTRDTGPRKAVYESFKKLGYAFSSVIHPAAVISPQAVLEEGVQIMAGAVLQTGCRIGKNTIINTRAAIDHDCQIGEHVHIAPGAVLSGNVRIGNGTHLGIGVIILQGITVGANCLIGAGAVVTRDIPDGAVALGLPARITNDTKPFPQS